MLSHENVSWFTSGLDHLSGKTSAAILNTIDISIFIITPEKACRFMSDPEKESIKLDPCALFL